MTEEQKQQLILHVRFHKPLYKGGAKTCYLCDKEVIEFTKITYYSDNLKFEINNDKDRELWLSQLNNIFLSADISQYYEAFIKFKDEKDLIHISSLKTNDFAKRVQNKKFYVYVDERGKYVFNNKSEVWTEKGLITYQDGLKYVLDCVDKNRINDIGTLLKTAQLYHLIEV